MSDTDLTDTDVIEDDTTTDDTEQTGPDTDEQTQETLRKLRSEGKNLRERMKAAEHRADELARALFSARVAATGLVENPAEIAFDADVLDDTEALAEVIDAAIVARPYIKARKVSGDAGQGQRGNPAGPQDFSSLFR